MNKNYDLVIFDLDGTLLDTSGGILKSCRYAIAQANFVMPDEDILASFIGPPVQWSFAKQFHLEKKEADAMADVFREAYKDRFLFGATAYDGIYDLCKDLRDRGIKLSVATYKREDYALRLLQHFHFDEYMDVMHGSDMEGKLKKQDIIELCIKESGVTDKRRVAMVGDTTHDAIGAKEIGVDFIGVTYGFGYKEEDDMKEEPYIGCANTPMEVLRCVI